MSLNFLSPNSKSISVLIEPSNAGTKSSYPFPPQQDLINRKIIGIESFCVIDFANDPNNSGVANMPVNLFNNAFLSMYLSATKNVTRKDGKQEAGLFYDRIPLCRLRTVTNPYNSGSQGATPSNVQAPFIIPPTEINWNKTTINFPTSVAFTVDVGAVFIVHYLDEGDNGEWWLRAMGMHGMPRKKVSGEDYISGESDY